MGVELELKVYRSNVDLEDVKTRGGRRGSGGVVEYESS
jgi:hypothetical protein